MKKLLVPCAVVFLMVGCLNHDPELYSGHIDTVNIRAPVSREDDV